MVALLPIAKLVCGFRSQTSQTKYVTSFHNLEYKRQTPPIVSRSMMEILERAPPNADQRVMEVSPSGRQASPEMHVLGKCGDGVASHNERERRKLVESHTWPVIGIPFGCSSF